MPQYPSNPTYTDNVYSRLMSLPVGASIEFDPRKGTQSDWERFLQAAKRFIDETRDHPLFDYEIQISNDYSSMRKKKYQNDIHHYPHP